MMREAIAMVIFLPKKLDTKTVFSITTQINNDKEVEYCLDITNLIFSLPFGALVLSTELAYICQKEGRNIKLRGYSEFNEVHSYLGHIGFFKTAYYSFGKEPGEARGNNRYIPIRKLSKKYFLDQQAEMENELGVTRPLQDFIQSESDKMALLITQKSDEVDAISYCFREIIRNVFEHGDADECIVCGQKWKNGMVEIGIVDNGCGILNSLKQKFDISSNAEALEMALQPGVSSKDINAKHVWSNSGFGLYILSELGKRFGKFMVCSGNQGIVCSSGQQRANNYGFHGTAIQITINLNDSKGILSVIDSIADEGEKIAAQKGRIVKASQKSRMVW